MTSRFKAKETLELERAKRFVALDNMTAQVPLIEVCDGCTRIWTAYDYKRECGTYTAISYDGSVSTITVYPSGRTVVKLNRPAD